MATRNTTSPQSFSDYARKRTLIVLFDMLQILGYAYYGALELSLMLHFGYFVIFNTLVFIALCGVLQMTNKGIVYAFIDIMLFHAIMYYHELLAVFFVQQ
jgi:hypothetical protein